MLDIHSHILPAVDDGAKTMEASLEMLKIAQDSGTKNIIATPHYYRGYYENRYEEIVDRVKTLNENAKKENIEINIFPGQEVFIDGNTLEDYERGFLGGLNGTNYMLVEFPMDKFPKNGLDIVYELKLKGVKPIIAHPERYLYIIEKPSFINHLIEEQCYFQLNAFSITGLFGNKVQKTAEVLIENGICDFIASDAHSINKRKPVICDTFNMLQNKNQKLIARILQNNDYLLQNKNIEFTAVKIKEKKSFFSFFKK